MTMNSVSLSTNPYVSQVEAANAVSTKNGSAPVESASSLMPEPTHGDVGLIIAQMAIENAFNQRKQARQDRQQANAAMIAAQKDQIAQMHGEAEKRYEAAQLEAWGKIAQGAHGIAGGVLSATSVRAKANDGIGKSVASAGDMYGGAFSLIAAGKKGEADQASAAAKEAEMEATSQKRALENADDEIKEAREHARTALDFLREFQSTQSKSMASAIKA